MKDITIFPHATIKDAMEALDKTAEKVLLVIDLEGALIGTLTDGDIRRNILKGVDLTATIQEAYCQDPLFVFEEHFTPEKVKPIFTENKINLIPILNNDRKIVDFITWEKLFGDAKITLDKMLDVPVVIMAGGRGARLEPFTKILPKPLIPVGEKPVIDHIIDRFRSYDLSQFYLTIHHKSKILRAYFEEKDPEYSIELAYEDVPRGTAGSLKLLNHKLDRPFFVSNCDIIIDADYCDFYHFHLKSGFDITLVASAKQFNIPYGVCDLNGSGSLKQIKEKPKYNFLVNTGLYILNPDVIDLIPDSGIFHITHLIARIIEESGEVGVYPVSENAWIDVGQWAEYRKVLKMIEGK